MEQLINILKKQFPTLNHETIALAIHIKKIAHERKNGVAASQDELLQFFNTFTEKSLSYRMSFRH